MCLHCEIVMDQSTSVTIVYVCFVAQVTVRSKAPHSGYNYHVYHGQYEYFPGSDVIIATP